jgi:cyanophycinase
VRTTVAAGMILSVPDQPSPLDRNRRVMSSRWTAAVVIAFSSLSFAGEGRAQRGGDGWRVAPVVGPPNGALVVVGGGDVGPDVVKRFIQLAGGVDAPIVIIPTAGGDSSGSYGQTCSCADLLRKSGAVNVRILHTYDRAVADADSFAAVIRRARGVWFPGGRQSRLADSYLGTQTERELHALLERGGVVGGTSAGASIQASYLVRGALSNDIVMSPGHERGFGFLRDVAIDQHVLTRHRLDDLPVVLAAHPELLGIGIDEGTALVVRGDRAEVIGRSRVFVYGGRDATDSGETYLSLPAGSRYDLAARRVVK